MPTAFGTTCSQLSSHVWCSMVPQNSTFYKCLFCVCLITSCVSNRAVHILIKSHLHCESYMNKFKCGRARKHVFHQVMIFQNARDCKFPVNFIQL